ncbi:NAD(P)-binding protein [Ramicandelaber brevisporus]|nr:NAD(P)-binding protein [Ramicandelaber brevisporus]
MSSRGRYSSDLAHTLLGPTISFGGVTASSSSVGPTTSQTPSSRLAALGSGGGGGSGGRGRSSLSAARSTSMTSSNIGLGLRVPGGFPHQHHSMSTSASTAASASKGVPEWVAQAPRLDNKLAIVTGASSGIGRELARCLALRGATVVFACRSEQKAKDAMTRILAEPTFIAQNPTVQQQQQAQQQVQQSQQQQQQQQLDKIKPEQLVFLAPINLADMDSIREFVDVFASSGLLQQFGGLHILVNNAGVFGVNSVSDDGFEMHFAVNHLAPFLLTNLLLEPLKAGAPSRIINVSSLAHMAVRNFNLYPVSRLRRGNALGYPFSKACSIMFTRELSSRLHGTGVTAYSVHPGIVSSDMYRSMPVPRVVLNWMMKDEISGARTSFYCATQSDIESDSGKYFVACKVAGIGGAASRPEHDAELWIRSAEWTGLALPQSLRSPSASSRLSLY